jgi:two-component system cell cycle response regulator DivK
MSEPLVLIVEDNDKNLKLVRDILELRGFRTLAATTAEDGLVLAAEHVPDVVLLDIQLPGMDGVAALERLKNDARTAHIPVVALTAFAMQEDRQRFLSAGFDGYLPKPIDVMAFPVQVRQFLREPAH